MHHIPTSPSDSRFSDIDNDDRIENRETTMVTENDSCNVQDVVQHIPTSPSHSCFSDIDNDDDNDVNSDQGSDSPSSSDSESLIATQDVPFNAAKQQLWMKQN